MDSFLLVGERPLDGSLRNRQDVEGFAPFLYTNHNHNIKINTMKKINSILAFVLGGLSFSLMPMACYATTIDAVSNSSSGIADANITATLNDGTILGFRRSGSTVYLCGAISQQTDLIIPDSIFYSSTRYAVNYIGYNRCDFDNAQSVTSLTLPSTVTNLSYLPSTVKLLHTSNYISSLTSSQLSNLNKVLVPQENLDSYLGNSNWTNYVLVNPEGADPYRYTINMTKAGEFAQLLLQTVEGWNKVNELTVIGDLNTDDLNVFKRMKQLTKLDLSRAVISDIPNQFDGASSTGTNRYGFNVLEELILPEVNNIGEYAFAECYRLKSVTMPKVNKLGYGAFSRLGASQITLPEGLSTISDYAFYYSKLEHIKIPSTVTEISNYCFRGCSYLKTIDIPSSITKVGYESFRESGLTSVNLPGVKTIDYNAFYNCTKLSNIQFAEGLVSFEGQPFYGCTGLTEIDLPSTFRSMSNQAFYGCTNIKKVISRAVVPPTHNNNNSILNGCDKTDVKLYVPAMSIDKYRTESGWKTFYTILPLEDKTSYAYIYDNSTIDDASEFTTNLDMTIDWCNQNRNGSTQYYCGALDFNGNSVLSMHDYKQYQYLGRSNSNNQYSYDAHFTSLIPNGTMRADNVSTTLRVYDTGTWYFISLPYDVKVSDIIYTEGTQFAIRKYSGNNRAQQSGNTWVNLTENDVMNAYEGYILRCNKQNADFTFPAINNANKNKVFEKESVVMPLSEYISEFEHNRSWNLIGNPYPCYYDTRRMSFTAPITVWNRYNQRYDAYSPVDDAYILHPSQSFFVQRPVDQSEIIFNKEGRQKTSEVQFAQHNAAKRLASNIKRSIYNVTLSDGLVEDHTRFVINETASINYELDKDASKFITDDNSSILVYTIENDVKYAINERPLASEVINLGFFVPSDGNYTLSVQKPGNEDVVLIDKETDTEHVMTSEYNFNATSGYNNNRFAIRFGGVTSIDSVNADNDFENLDVPYTVYSTDGRVIGTYNAGTNANLPKGIYVISIKDVKHKILVK